MPKMSSRTACLRVVLYGLFRYLFLVHQGDVSGAPEDLLFKDRPLLLAVVAWAALAVGILYLDH